MYSRNNDYGCKLRIFYYDDIRTNDVRVISTKRDRKRGEVGEERRKTLREDELRESCIIERLRSFVMVPYSSAILGIEGSDEKKQEKNELGTTLGTVLGLLLTRHRRLCSF